MPGCTLVVVSGFTVAVTPGCGAVVVGGCVVLTADDCAVAAISLTELSFCFIALLNSSSLFIRFSSSLTVNSALVTENKAKWITKRKFKHFMATVFSCLTHRRVKGLKQIIFAIELAAIRTDFESLMTCN